MTRDFFFVALLISLSIASLTCLIVWGKPGLGAKSAEKTASFTRLVFVMSPIFLSLVTLRALWEKYMP